MAKDTVITYEQIRKREYMADANAVSICGYANSLANATNYK